MSNVEQLAPPSVTAADAARAIHMSGKYLSLTSYRRDGSAVATPVWFVADAGRLLVVTGAESGKVKRIRRDPRVTVAPCTGRGSLRGAPTPARADFLPESEHDRVDRLMAEKYRVDRVLVLPIYRLAMRLKGQGKAVTGPGAYLAITATMEDRVSDRSAAAAR